jgi:hypothetical protein
MKMRDFLLGVAIFTVPTLGVQILRAIEVNGGFSRAALRGLHARV